MSDRNQHIRTTRMHSHKCLSLMFLLLLPAICFLARTSSSQENSTGDSANTAASHWSIDPAYKSVKSRVSYVPGIKVVRGKTQVIVPEQEFFCPAGSVFKFNNGDIQVYDRRSSDGGKTWVQVEQILENSVYQYPAPDGEVVMFMSLTSAGAPTSAARPEVSLQDTNEKNVREAQFFRSTDDGRTRISDPAKIYLPEAFDGWVAVLCRKIVALPDDSLLMSMYCRDKEGDTFERKYRSLALRSTDRGKTWHYLSTIAFDMTEGERGEGFDETALLVLPGGEVLSFIRSGASYQASIGSFNNNDPSVDMPFGYAKQTPIYMSTSIDGAKNWSNADPISPYGVWPDAVLMENGLLVVSYGRPGNWMMFSKDEGKSWGPIIPFYHDLYPPDCSNYFSLAEVAPDVLLVVYARTNPNDHWQSELVGTYFHVEPEEG